MQASVASGRENIEAEDYGRLMHVITVLADAGARILEEGRRMEKFGPIQGLDGLQCDIDDARALNAAEEYDRILLPVEDLLSKVGAGNPNPERYGD